MAGGPVEERGDLGDAERRSAGARLGFEGGIDLGLHALGDLVAVGDLVDGERRHAVADAVPDGVLDHALDLFVPADLGVDAGRLLGVDLPADGGINVHPHLLTGERRNALGLLAGTRPLLLPGGEALNLRPGQDKPDAGEQWLGVHLAEGVQHSHLTGIDDDERAGGEGHDAQDGQHQAYQAREGGAGARCGTGLHARRGGEDNEGDEQEDEAQDQAGHNVSGVLGWITVN